MASRQTELFLANQVAQFEQHFITFFLHLLDFHIYKPALKWSVPTLAREVEMTVIFQKSFVHFVSNCVEIRLNEDGVYEHLLEELPRQHVCSPLNESDRDDNFVPILLDMSVLLGDGNLQKSDNLIEFAILPKVFHLFTPHVAQVETLREGLSDVCVMVPDQVLHVVSKANLRCE